MDRVAYDVLLAMVDGVALALVARGGARVRSGALALWATAVVGLAMVVGALAGLNGFGAIRLLSHGVFLHGPCVALGGAFLLRRRAPRALGASLVAFALTVVAVGIDAFFIEPRSLVVSRPRVVSPRVARPIRVAVLADLQTDELGHHERNVLATTMAERPDLILLPGDYVQVHDRRERHALQDALREVLRELRFGAPLGVHAVAGNNDDDDWARLFEGLPVELYERTRSVDLPGLRITGLSVRDSYTTTLHVPPAPPDRFHLVFGHYPDFALGRIDADLLVAGHTHGGQVALPFVGPLLTLSKVPRAWASGVTRLDERRTLVVSRGIGMERDQAPRLRFLCRPELVMLELDR